VRGGFNRRHKRVGPLFQNRDTSIVVEADPYRLERVRYLHLTPLRATGVANLRALDRSPWTGHSALLGHVPRPWQAAAALLAPFGPPPRRARAAHRTFVGDGIPRGRRPDFHKGGPVRGGGPARGPGGPAGGASRGHACRSPPWRPSGCPSSPSWGTAPTRAAVQARQLVAYVWLEHLGQRASGLARALGQNRGSGSLAAKRGTAHTAAWRAQIADWCR
jgi:hypothetical protein